MKDTRAIVRREERLGPKELPLADIREEQGLTQEKVAKRAKITQSEVSRTELRDDYLVSTLDRYAAALGGELSLLITINGQPYFVRR